MNYVGKGNSKALVVTEQKINREQNVQTYFYDVNFSFTSLLTILYSCSGCLYISKKSAAYFVHAT